MRRRRTFLIIFVILILILIVGVGGLVLLGGLGGGGQKPPTTAGEEGLATPTAVVKVRRVVVALQTIPRGMRIPPDAVEIREWPETDPAFPVDSIDDLNDVVGMVARVEIPMHRPIGASSVKVVFLGEGSEFSLAIPKGKVAIAVPITALSAVANALRPGDRVDVIISFSIVEVDEDSQIKLPLVLVGGEDCLAGCQPTGEQIPRLVTQYTVQNALVLGVGLWTEETAQLETTKPSEVGAAEPTPVVAAVVEGEAAAAPPPAAPASIATALTDVKVVTLVVNPQDALVLKWLRESNASIDMVMRSAIDEDIFSTEAVTLQYMVDRFAISLPPKLPNTPENEFKYSLIDTALQYSTQPPTE